MGDDPPGQVVLRSLKSKAEQATESKPVSSISLWSLSIPASMFLSWPPSVKDVSCQIK